MSAVPAIRSTGTRTSLRVVSRAKPSFGTIVLSRAMMFACIALGTFLVSSMCGQVMVENSRREGLRAVSRLKEARKAESILRRRLDALTSLASIESWSKAHGYFPPDVLVQPQKKAEEATVVAQLD